MTVGRTLFLCWCRDGLCETFWMIHQPNEWKPYPMSHGTRLDGGGVQSGEWCCEVQQGVFGFTDIITRDPHH